MSDPSPPRPLEQLKVAELREELKKRGLSLKGVKKDLFERLEEAVRKEQTGVSEGVEDAYQHEGEHRTIYSEGDSQEGTQDVSSGDTMLYLNDSDMSLQDSALILNNASPYMGASDATPVFMELHKGTEKLEPENRVNVESNVDASSLNGIACSDDVAPESVQVNDISCTANDTALEPNHEAVANDSPSLNIPAVENEAALPVHDNQALEPVGPDGENDMPILPVAKNQVGGNITGMAEPKDGPGLDIRCTSDAAGENIISVQESAQASDSALAAVGDKEVASVSVPESSLNVADASVSAMDNTVVEPDCPMQDVEVFEKTNLTSVSVVPCVQECAEDRNNGGVEVRELVKENLLTEYSKQVEVQGTSGTPPLIAVDREILETPHHSQDIAKPEAVQDIVRQEVGQDIKMPESEQDTAMVETHEAVSVDMKMEASEAAFVVLPTAAQDVVEPFVSVKSEDVGNVSVGDSGKPYDPVGVKVVDEGKPDIKVEPLEAESRAGKRYSSIDIVKREHQDRKEEPHGRSNRLWMREYENKRTRQDLGRDLKYGETKNRGEGRVFKEEGRNEIKERNLKPDEDEIHARSTQKRKEDERDPKQLEPAKRMRRWNSRNEVVVETATQLTTGSAKEIVSSDIKKEGAAVVAPKLTPRTSVPLRSIPPAGKVESETNSDKRAVPPSTRAPTTSLLIEKFVRPFTLKAVKDMLAEFGHCVDFWMDQIKTHCYVTYAKVEEAVDARNGLYNKQWPLAFGNLLVADFVDAREVKSRSDGTFEKANATPTTTPRVIINLPPAPTTNVLAPSRGYLNALASAPPLRERPPMQPPTKDVEPPIPTLDDLFRKTKVKPHIYYLPLTDEQVIEKLAAVKNKEHPLKSKLSGKSVGF